MTKCALLLTRTSKFSSHHVRELLLRLQQSNITIYTDEHSNLVLSECIAMNIYPFVCSSLPAKQDELEFYFIDENPESRFSKYIATCTKRGIKFELVNLKDG